MGTIKKMMLAASTFVALQTAEAQLRTFGPVKIQNSGNLTLKASGEVTIVKDFEVELLAHLKSLNKNKL